MKMIIISWKYLFYNVVIVEPLSLPPISVTAWQQDIKHCYCGSLGLIEANLNNDYLIIPQPEL